MSGFDAKNAAHEKYFKFFFRHITQRIGIHVCQNVADVSLKKNYFLNKHAQRYYTIIHTLQTILMS